MKEIKCRLLPVLALLILFAGGIADMSMRTMAGQLPLPEIIESYCFQDQYFLKDMNDSVLSSWGVDNPGRLHWTMLRSQYYPVKAGGALLTDPECPAYAQLVLQALVKANEDLPEETHEQFAETLQELLPDTDFGEQAGGIPALVEAASEKDDAELYGMDTILGLSYIDQSMLEAFEAVEADEADGNEFSNCLYAKKALYYAMLHVYQVSKEESSQEAYLTEQLAILSEMDEDNAAEAESYNAYLDRTTEKLTEGEGKAGLLQPLR